MIAETLSEAVTTTQTGLDSFFGKLSGIYLGTLSLSSILSAIVIFIICLIVTRILSKVLGKAMEKSKLEKGLKSFILSAIRIGLWAIVIVIVAESLGIPTASLVAVLSVAGLALSLAIQGIASNLFSGVTVLATKPFVSGDYVELGGVSGTVHAVGLFHTTILTVDNKLIYVPNSDVTSSKIINYSHEPKRRVDITVNVAYDSPIEEVKAALTELMEGDARILHDPAPFVSILSYKGSTVEYVIRAWVNTADYWDVYFALNEGLLPALAKHGCEMSYDHVNVHMVQ